MESFNPVDFDKNPQQYDTLSADFDTLHVYALFPDHDERVRIALAQTTLLFSVPGTHTSIFVIKYQAQEEQSRPEESFLYHVVFYKGHHQSYRRINIHSRIAHRNDIGNSVPVHPSVSVYMKSEKGQGSIYGTIGHSTRRDEDVAYFRRVIDHFRDPMGQKNHEPLIKFDDSEARFFQDQLEQIYERNLTIIRLR